MEYIAKYEIFLFQSDTAIYTLRISWVIRLVAFTEHDLFISIFVRARNRFAQHLWPRLSKTQTYRLRAASIAKKQNNVLHERIPSAGTIMLRKNNRPRSRFDRDLKSIIAIIIIVQIIYNIIPPEHKRLNYTDCQMDRESNINNIYTFFHLYYFLPVFFILIAK